MKAKFEELRPDAIITFGPDAEYRHSEDTVVGSLVQKLLLREGWAEKEIAELLDVARNDKQETKYFRRLAIERKQKTNDPLK